MKNDLGMSYFINNKLAEETAQKTIKNEFIINSTCSNFLVQQSRTNVPNETRLSNTPRV